VQRSPGATTLVAPVGQAGSRWNSTTPDTARVRYAGYRGEDGSVVGDPLHIGLTTFAKQLGWHSAGTAFDILPLMIRVDGGPVQLFDVPKDGS
jgi:nitric-oxide synthase, bacterial